MTHTSAVLVVLCFLQLVVPGQGHGYMTVPRSRGAYCSNRPVGDIEACSEVEETDFCAHCLNAGGVDALRGQNGGVWTPYRPLHGMFRNGATLCGDPSGSNDHTADGRYGSPEGATGGTLRAGSIATFEFDATAPHGGYLQFYMCFTNGNDITHDSFSNGDCELLRRAPVDFCESGSDSRCGPIDDNDDTKWYLPCRVSSSDDQDQIMGRDGEIAYYIPNRLGGFGVVHMYWLTANQCNPEGFVDYYSTNDRQWNSVINSRCDGDGGTIGGYNPSHVGTCATQAGKFPEEFWNCADVRVIANDSPIELRDSLSTGSENEDEQENRSNEEINGNSPEGEHDDQDEQSRENEQNEQIGQNPPNEESSGQAESLQIEEDRGDEIDQQREQGKQQRPGEQGEQDDSLAPEQQNLEHARSSSGNPNEQKSEGPSTSEAQSESAEVMETVDDGGDENRGDENGDSIEAGENSSHRRSNSHADSHGYYHRHYHSNGYHRWNMHNGSKGHYRLNGNYGWRNY